MTTEWSGADMPDQSGKSFVVTGANSGIGYEAALALASKHALVVLACRTPQKGRQAVDAIRTAVPDASVEFEHLDLGSLASVRAFAERFSSKHGRLDALINNAGVMAIPRRTTEDGFEMQLGVNHLGHFALTGLLLRRLIESAPSRVVTVSSMVHTRGTMDFDDLQFERRGAYNKWAAYCRSKLANLLFAYELQRRIKDRHPNVMSVACHPGYAATHLQFVGPEMTGSAFGKAIMAAGHRLFAQSAREGALPTLYAATANDVGGGDFIGPSGPFHMRGAPIKQRSHRRSHDTEAGTRLWQESTRLTGVGYL
jgi:NAD(P)-dependent dehydrogenase (short-subunit alcohol dehydrogenase family)